MPNRDLCPTCGSERPANAPQGFCPRCLLLQGLGSDAFGLARGGEPAATMTLTTEQGRTSVMEDMAATLGPISRVLLDDTEPFTGPGPIVEPTSPEMPGPAGRPDRLQLLGEIARGGMGAVLKGRDADLGRDLAVKVLLEKHRDRPEMLLRFLEEAQIAGQLQHPGIVPVYELGSFDDRRPYFTMKLVKGRTLAEILADRPDPSHDQPRLIASFLQVAQTVAYAHARGVIHRDLKPSNVMVGSFGEVQVMDWGLAKVLARGGVVDDASAGKRDDEETVVATARSAEGSDLSLAGSVLGTPAYMAPEQARGEIAMVDRRADVFALGSILAEILTGSPAFVGRSSGEILRTASRGDLADARSRLDACGADAELATLARDCLAAEADDRPRDAGVVADRVRDHLAGVQERLRSAERERAVAEARAVEERRRRKLQVGLAASLLGLAVLGGLGAASYSQRRQAIAARADLALNEAELLLRQARARAEDPAGWQAAEASVKGAEPFVTDLGDPSATGRLASLRAEARAGADVARRDRKLLSVLVDIRSGLQDNGARATDAAYAAAFREAGLDLDVLPADQAAERLRARPKGVALELASYLDAWAELRYPDAPCRPLFNAARAADPDPYRDDLRRLLARDDPAGGLAKLKVLAADPRSDDLPAPAAVLLAGALVRTGDGAVGVDLLRRAVSRHPGDVWVNHNLADAIERLKPASHEKAIRYYQAARAIRPETSHNLAHLLAETGRDGEAERVYRDLVARRPDDLRDLACFGGLLTDRRRSAEAAVILGRAVAAGRAALARRPDDAGSHLHLGIALKNQGKLTEAEAAFREAIRLDPEPAAHFNLGVALGGQKKLEEAIDAFREAIRLKPDFAAAYINIGSTLRDQRKPAEAIDAYRKAIRLKPDFAEAHNNLGETLRALGRLEEAIAALREAIRLKPDFVMAHNNLGIALRDHGEPAEAIDALRRAIRLDPDDAGAHYNLGMVLGGQGKPEAAINAYREAIRLKPEYAEAHGNLGNALRAQGKASEAIASFREAARLRPDHVAQYNLGLALLDRSSLEEASVAFREVTRLKPDFAPAHKHLGTILQALGKPVEAIDAFREAIHMQPDYAEAHCGLGLVLKTRGMYREALAEVRLGHELGSKRKDWPYPSIEWVRQSERDLAASERLPAVIRGEDRPKDASERITFASMAYDRKAYAASARLYAEALEAEPKWAEDRQAGHAYNAACAAALAGCGQGEDDPKPDDIARGKLRVRALGWLKAELSAWSKLMEVGPPAARVFARQTLEHWKVDADLAGVRDADGLAKLPEPEREGWRSLWAEVDALLRKAQSAPAPPAR